LIQVTVKLHSVLAKYLRHKQRLEKVILPDNASVKDLLVQLNLNHGEVGVILVDGELVRETAVLTTGSVVELYPMFSGG